jgi:hypothetical protein
MAEIVNFLTRILTPQPAIQAGSIRRAGSRTSSNPFATGNPFVNSNKDNPYVTYGQNHPVPGGYFAGYYNNQPNIVGRRLFIEA